MKRVLAVVVAADRTGTVSGDVLGPAGHRRFGRGEDARAGVAEFVLVGPLGVLGGGWLGDLLGPGRVIAASGVGYRVVAAYWSAVPTLRRFPAVESIEPGRFGA